MISTGVHYRRACALAAAVLLAIAQDAAADGLLAGEWHTVQTPEINGIIGPPQKGTRCLTPEAVADLDTTFSPVSRTTNSSCERVEHELTPQRLKWRLQCSGQIDMDVQGEFTSTAPNIMSPLLRHAHSCRDASCSRCARRSRDSASATARNDRRPGLLPLSLELIS